MFYGVSQSTDLRSRGTVIKKFSSKASLLSWMGKGNGEFTHKNPEAEGNYHHTFKYGYELKGRVNKKHPCFSQGGSRDYKRTDEDNLAHYLYLNGTPIERE